MSTSPAIAVVAYHLEAGRISSWRTGAYAVPEPYVDAIRRAGATAMVVLPGDGTAAAHMLGRFQGLLLVGGGDVDPVRYGERPHEAIAGLEPDRDALEIDLLREARRLEVPTLAVCRGMQVMNVAFAGTLVQHLPDDRRFQRHAPGSPDEQVLHDVRAAVGSRLATATGAATFVCSSRHHQGVDRLGEGIVATGWTPDGLIEAIESSSAGWMLGVQWHPEDTAGRDATQQGLFDALVAAAGER